MIISATVVNSNTFVGNGLQPNVLIIQPTFEAQTVGYNYENRNAQEAAEVFMWLQAAFCNKTLAELAERLSVYNQKEPK
jgi:hypothetical protein